jgi:hypothetical protein
MRIEINRVPECLSLRRNWVFPNPLPWKSVYLPTWTLGGGGQYSLAGGGVEGPNSDDWTESLALCKLCEYMIHMKIGAWDGWLGWHCNCTVILHSL